jgi:hypothetical protein
MSDRAWVGVLLGLLAAGGMAAGCSSPKRPSVRADADAPRSCSTAVAAAFPDGRRGTLPAYREAVRLCPSLAELARLDAYDGAALRLDCAPADVLALGGEIPQVRDRTPTAPADLFETPVCRQFNQECADYEEVRRDHAALARNPTVANRGLYLRSTALFDACARKYG